MVDNTDNLPVPVGHNGQQLLFSESQWQEDIIVESERARGVFTFDRLQAKEPDRAEMILSLLVEPGVSQRQIAIICKCSRNSVAAASRWMLEHVDNVEPLKKRSAALWGAVRQLCGERAIELLCDPSSKLTLRDLAIMGGTAQDKELLLRGEATQIIGDLKSGGPSHSDFAEYLRQLPVADVQESGSMGSAGDFPAQKGAAGAAGEEGNSDA